jgi:uncharacterized membrane protein YgaE (UPF0421/DUF939 family)
MMRLLVTHCGSGSATLVIQMFVNAKNETKRKVAKRNKAKIVFLSLRREKNFSFRFKAKKKKIFSLRSEKFEAKRSENKRKIGPIFFAWASENKAKRILFRFVSLRSEKNFKAKPAHPITSSLMLIQTGKIRGKLTWSGPRPELHIFMK